MFLALLIAALFAGEAPPDGIPARMIFLPADTVVEAVNCDQWERWTHKGNQLWRANYGAEVTTDSGTLRLQSGDVSSGSAPDLWFTIEFQCASEYGAGVWDAS